MKSRTGREVVGYVVKKGRLYGGRYADGPAWMNVRCEDTSDHQRCTVTFDAQERQEAEDYAETYGGRVVAIVKREKAGAFEAGAQWTRDVMKAEAITQARAEGEAKGRAEGAAEEREEVASLIDRCATRWLGEKMKEVSSRIRARGPRPAPREEGEHVVEVRDSGDHLFDVVVNGDVISTHHHAHSTGLADRLRAALAKGGGK